METLPNGLTVFNATPHAIRFWLEGWEGPVEVPPDQAVSARPVETEAGRIGVATLVRTEFVGTPEGEQTARRALAGGADIVVGSIIAAQAYPGLVMAMTPSPGYERVPPTEKRMRPDKFTVYTERK